jgi:hypothetical protein
MVKKEQNNSATDKITAAIFLISGSALALPRAVFTAHPGI